MSNDPGTDEKDVRKGAESSNQVEEKIIANEIDGHEYVDLGLSVKWAAMNIGATKVSDHGGYRLYELGRRMANADRG